MEWTIGSLSVIAVMLVAIYLKLVAIHKAVEPRYDIQFSRYLDVSDGLKQRMAEAAIKVMKDEQRREFNGARVVTPEPL